MIKEAIKHLVEMGRPELVDVDGRKYATHDLRIVKEPTPEALVVKTLTSLVEYIKSGVDEGILKERKLCNLI